MSPSEPESIYITLRSAVENGTGKGAKRSGPTILSETSRAKMFTKHVEGFFDWVTE
jgi:hypothetical protein